MNEHEQIAFEWKLPANIGAAAEADHLSAVLKLDPEADVVLLPSPRGVVPLDEGAILMGVMALTGLARRILDLVCVARHPGIIIDARIKDRVEIHEQKSLPGGTVITIAADGSQTRENVCGGDFKLGRLISMLKSSS